MYGQSKRDFETRNPGPVDALPALAHLVGQRRSARCRQFTCGCNATSAFCDEGRWPQDEREGDLDGQSECCDVCFSRAGKDRSRSIAPSKDRFQRWGRTAASVKACRTPALWPVRPVASRRGRAGVRQPLTAPDVGSSRASGCSWPTAGAEATEPSDSSAHPSCHSS